MIKRIDAHKITAALPGDAVRTEGELMKVPLQDELNDLPNVASSFMANVTTLFAASYSESYLRSLMFNRPELKWLPDSLP